MCRYLIIAVCPNITATCKGVAPLGEDPSLAIANLRRSRALCKSLRLPSRAAMCTAWILPLRKQIFKYQNEYFRKIQIHFIIYII